MVIVDNRRNIRSFGRIAGRGNKIKNQALLEELVEIYGFKLENFDAAGVNHLEIGFGYGDSLVERARMHPTVENIGCETYINGVVNLLKAVDLYSLENVKVFNGDARILLEILPDSSLDKVFLLYPDPWPKKRHRRRRIINEDFLELVTSKLKLGGTLFFASDVEDYVIWTLNMVKNSGLLTPLVNDLVEDDGNNGNGIMNIMDENPLNKTQEDENACSFKSYLEEIRQEPSWWVETRYQARARAGGRNSYFLEFEKR